jgi:hypothetical protein
VVTDIHLVTQKYWIAIYTPTEVFLKSLSEVWDFRETAYASLPETAEAADVVYLLVCGIPVKVK